MYSNRIHGAISFPATVSGRAQPDRFLTRFFTHRFYTRSIVSLLFFSMYRSEHIGVVRGDPYTYATLSKWTGVTTPQRLYDVFQPLMKDWSKSDCLSAWHGHQAFSLVFPNVHTLAETTIHQLSVAIEEGGGKAFVRLCFVTVYEPWSRRLFFVLAHCIVIQRRQQFHL